MTAAIPYVRFSTPKQEKGDSKERQLETCLSFIEQKGWIAQPALMDLGLSAYKGDHLHSGALGKFTRQVIDGEIPEGTILVVEQLDRLSRQGHRKALRWLEDMTERGIKIAVVGQNRVYDHASLSSNLIETLEVLITGKAAHDYSVRLSERVGSAWKKKIERTQDGVLLSRSCPGWLEPVADGTGDDGTAFRIIESRALAVRQIYQWSVEGYGIQKITHMLNDNPAFKAWGRSGGGWAQTHILRLLENPAPEGDYVPYLNNRKKENGERVIGYYPRIVDADLVARARAALKSRKGTGSTKTDRAVYRNLFAGIGKCAKCGGRMAMRRGPLIVAGKVKHPGYLSCETQWLGRGCEGVGMIRYLDFETAAVREVLHLAMDEQFFRQPQLAIQMSAEFAEAEKALQDLIERRDNIMNLMERSSDPEPLLMRYEALATEVRRAEEAKSKAETELTKARGQVSTAEQIAAARAMSDAILSDDVTEREQARMKVAQAMKAAITDLVFDNKSDELDAKGRRVRGGKEIELSTPLVTFFFDGQGNSLDPIDFTDFWDEKDDDFVSLITRHKDPALLNKMSQRRRNKPVSKA